LSNTNTKAFVRKKSHPIQRHHKPPFCLKSGPLHATVKFLEKTLQFLHRERVQKVANLVIGENSLKPEQGISVVAGVFYFLLRRSWWAKNDGDCR
jgi:hypothetical protein